MARYEETLENLKIKEICGGCTYFGVRLDCDIHKEAYRDSIEIKCKFYEKN